MAYGYEERGLRADDWVRGARKVRIRKVTLRIYDPNCPMDDGVELWFFNCRTTSRRAATATTFP